MKKAKLVVAILGLAASLFLIQACGKNGGFGVGGNVIISGAGQ